MQETLTRLLAQATGLAPETLHLAPRAALEHQSNRLYDLWADGRHLIVKEYLKPDEWPVAPVREFQALQLLRPLDIAPRPALVHPSPAPGLGPIVVYEWMDGAMWDRRRPTGEELAQLADLWLVMHAVSRHDLWLSRGYERSLAETAADFAARFQAYAAWAEAAFPAGRPAADLCRRVLESRLALVADLDARAPVLRFCRSDARFANVIQRPDGRLGLVDWEDSGLRDPARDVADLLTHANQEDLLSWDDWQAFLQPYLAAQGQADPQLGERARRYLALFPIFWLVVLIGAGLRRAGAGRLAGWTINDLPANQRLRRYLARALAWPDQEFADQLGQLGGVVFFPADEGTRGPAPG